MDIKNFKGIEHLSFAPKKINVIVGPNNTGKSTVMHGIFLGIASMNRLEVPRVMGDVVKGCLLANPLEYTIFKKGKSSTIDLALETDQGVLHKISVRLHFLNKDVPEDLTFETWREKVGKQDRHYFMLEDRLSRLLRQYQGKKNEDLEITREIDTLIFDKEQLFKQHFDKSIRDTLFLDVVAGEEALLRYFIPRKVQFPANQGTLEYYMKERRVVQDVDDFVLYKERQDLLDQMQLDMNMPTCVMVGGDALRDFTRVYKILANHPSFLATIQYMKENLTDLVDIREAEDGMVVYMQGIEGEPFTVPISSMGDGFKALASLIALIGSGIEIMLLEEPEHNLHPGYLKLLAERVVEASGNVQFFINTHSQDLIKELVESVKEKEKLDQLVVVRLSRLGECTEREVLVASDIDEELEQIKVDLRGY